MEEFFRKRVEGESVGLFIGKIIVGTILVIGFAILFGYAVMWLWNQLMPELFGLKSITYWQAVGLFILAKIFFGSGDCGGRKKEHSSKKKRMRHKFKPYYDKYCKEQESGWKHYDQFWEEEGSRAYKKFVERLDENKQNANN